ncbi:hypothetical protein QQ045_011321 [Rhodiola kirilowii]
MAQKKPTPPFPVEQHSSSSDEEEEVSKGEEEASPFEQSDSSSDDEVQEEVSSESEEETEEEEEETNVTPVAPVKPVVVVQSPPKVRPAKITQQPDLAPASAVKRPREESKAADGNNSKKFKKKVADDVVKNVEDYPKTPLFQRVFSEDDEIGILNALLHYSSKKCIDPIEDITDFHDFVKKYINVDVTRSQLTAKISKIKSKYMKNARKRKETFGKTHDQSCYDLSKKIWGKSSSGCGRSESSKTNRKGKDQKDKHASGIQIPQVVKEPVGESSSSLFCLSELAKTSDLVGMTGFSYDIYKKGFELLSDEARAALEDKWKNMVTAELELNCKRLKLSREQMKLSLDALGHRG